MPGQGRIEEEAVVLEVKSDRVYRVGLVNGHELWAWVSRRDSGEKQFSVGDHVRVEISVYDVSHGRIVSGCGGK